MSRIILYKDMPVRIDNRGVVIHGQRRVVAAKAAGIAMVQCVVFDAIERLPKTYASSEELAEALKESWDLPEE